jgi:hypothetical protein
MRWTSAPLLPIRNRSWAPRRKVSTPSPARPVPAAGEQRAGAHRRRRTLSPAMVVAPRPSRRPIRPRTDSTRSPGPRPRGRCAHRDSHSANLAAAAAVNGPSRPRRSPPWIWARGRGPARPRRPSIRSPMAAATVHPGSRGHRRRRVTSATTRTSRSPWRPRTITTCLHLRHLTIRGLQRLPSIPSPARDRRALRVREEPSP